MSPPEEFARDGVAHRRTLEQRGISVGRIRRAVASGKWQEPIPGVVVGHGGPLSRRQRWRVALCHAGAEGCLSHRSALLVLDCRIEEHHAARRVAGVRGGYDKPSEGGLVEVSVAHGRHLRSSGFVVVHQTRRALEPVSADGLLITPPARSAVDVAVTCTRRPDVDHVISHVLQRGLVDVEALAAETRALGRRATSWLRAAVQDAARGMRSVGESELRRVIRGSGLPEPEWNAPVETRYGTYWVDALWRELGVGAEADGAAFHLSAEDWGRDLLRQNAVQEVGLRLIRLPVRRMRAAPVACRRDLVAFVAPNGVAR